MATWTREELLAGRMDGRVESKITDGLDTVIDQVAHELAGGGDITSFRSRAVRELLVAGALARGEQRPTRRRRLTRNG
jgi:hypothetical protein